MPVRIEDYNDEVVENAIGRSLKKAVAAARIKTETAGTQKKKPKEEPTSKGISKRTDKKE